MLDPYFDDSKAEAHKEALAKSLRTVGLDELRELGEKLFPEVSHPWRDAFFNFLKENEDATFYQASTKDGINLVYCREKDKGIWFVENGVGPMQQRGRNAMKSILENK